jgi:hypothetical protein
MKRLIPIRVITRSPKFTDVYVQVNAIISGLFRCLDHPFAIKATYRQSSAHADPF